MAVLAITRGQQQYQYTEWVAVGIPSEGQSVYRVGVWRYTDLDLVGIPILHQSVYRLHPIQYTDIAKGVG